MNKKKNIPDALLKLWGIKEEPTLDEIIANKTTEYRNELKDVKTIEDLRNATKEVE